MKRYWLSILAIPLLANAETLSPFGIGSCYTNSRSVEDLERWLPQMAEAGIHFLRSPATSWNAVEPAQGKWQWETLDAQMAYLEKHQMGCGGLLLGGVPWGKSEGLPVENVPAWSNYVAQVVKHLQGKVKYWEVWNEPPNFIGPKQTAADYAKIVVAAYNAAKAADPACLIGLAAKSAHVNFLEQTIKSGAKDHFDFITLHPYEVLGSVTEHRGTEAVFLNIVPTVRKMLAAQNPGKVNVPIIFTEIGADTKAGEELPAEALVKAYTLGMAQGVACIEWFEGRDGDSGPMGLLDDKGAPRPAYQAMKQMIQHFGQHPEYLGWVLVDDWDYGFVFQGAKDSVLVTWARGDADHVKFGQKVEILNPITGVRATTESYSLTKAPMLVLGVPQNLLNQAKANKALPLPWGGDYSKAKSVSIKLEGTVQENGLHTLSGDAIGAAVLAYGGSGRSGNVPGGNAFVVDPQFLSYTSTPIEIKVVVRRNQANDNAGFKLVYESTAGFKGGDWYTIPDNKEWYTISWKITDAQFVNMWGYNFLLESDGDQYNKYFIQSVTVTKLD